MPILILLILLVFPSLAEATTYFDEGFEYTSQSALEAVWASSCTGNSGILRPNTNRPHSGLRSLEELVNNFNSCSIELQHAITADVYTRFWYNTAAFTYDVDVPTKLLFEYMCCAQGAILTVFRTGQNSLAYYSNISNFADAASCPTGTNPTGNNGCEYPANLGSTAINPNTWYCIEQHFNVGSANTTNGIVQMWINGTLVLSYTNILLNGGGNTQGFYNSKTYVQHGIGTRYVDDWAVANTRINDCPGAGPPDTTPPTQVTGLAVGAPSASSLFITATNGTDNVDTSLNLRLERCTVTSVNPCTNFSLDTTSGVTGGSITTQTDGGLAASTTFCYRANNQDSSGNQGAYSATACGTTSAGSGTTRHTLGTDTFNRADAADVGASYDAGYTGHNALKIVSNAVLASATGFPDSQESRSDAVANNQWIEATLGAWTGADFSQSAVFVRIPAPATSGGYPCVWVRNGGGNTSFIYETGVGSPLAASASETWATGDRARCEVQGTAISFYRNDVLILTATSATYTSGRVGMSMASTTLTNNSIDAISWGDYTVAVQPTITNAVTDATGSTLTSGGSTPAFLRVQTNTTNVVYTWNDGVVMTAGRYTQPGGGWAAGLTFVCFFAQDSNHVESSNSADWQCDSLVGLTMTPDTTPPVLSGASPSGTLAQGTTSTTISMVSDELADLKYSTTDIAYASMASSMTTVDGLHHSATVTGLTDGVSKTYYVRGQDRSTALNQDTTSTLISFQVGIAVDTIPPILSGGAPSGILPAGTTSVSMSVNTNENATCKYGTIAGTAYASIASTFTTGNGTLVHSQTISGLTNGNTYTEYVRCTDGSNANTSDYVITWSITALAPDVTPPVRSAGAPSGVKVSGTTSVSMTLTTSENATCKYGIAPGVAYASIANTFSTTGTTSHSQTIGSLIDGQISTYFIRCRDAALNANPDDYIITWSVAVANDATPPTAPTNLICIAFSSSQASCTFTAGTDGIGVVSNVATIGISSGGVCTPTVIVAPGWGTSSPQQLINLTGNTPYCVTMTAKDLAGNTSSASNQSNFTTPVLGDPIPPSDVTNLNAPAATVLVNSVTLNWDAATDNSGINGYNVFRCEVGIDCPNFIIKFFTPTTTLTDVTNLKPLTEYHYIVFASDLSSNVSVNPSNEISVTTPALPAGTTQANCPCRTRTH